jgi:hypothetical protein
MRDTYRDLKIHKFLRESTHLIIEAEFILSCLSSREHEISLSLFLPIKNDFLSRSYNLVIDIEGTS